MAECEDGPAVSKFPARVKQLAYDVHALIATTRMGRAPVSGHVEREKTGSARSADRKAVISAHQHAAGAKNSGGQGLGY